MSRQLAGIMFAVLSAGVISLYGADEKTEEAKAWQARRLTEMESFPTVLESDKGDTPLKLEKTSVLSWSNPIRNTPAGAVYVWTMDGMPRLIASAYPYTNGIEAEFTSLCDQPLQMSNLDRPFHRFTPGITWQPVADADPPHMNRVLRLTQMRRLAERFQVKGNGQSPFDTRLLTQPLYRSPASAPVDGAVFAFVQGTDPEAVLILEATEKPNWRFAFARMSTVPLIAKLDDVEVWNLPACWSVRMMDQQPFRALQFPGSR